MDLSTTEHRMSVFNFETKALLQTASSSVELCVSSYEGLSAHNMSNKQKHMALKLINH